MMFGAISVVSTPEVSLSASTPVTAYWLTLGLSWMTMSGSVPAAAACVNWSLSAVFTVRSMVTSVEDSHALMSPSHGVEPVLYCVKPSHSVRDVTSPLSEPPGEPSELQAPRATTAKLAVSAVPAIALNLVTVFLLEDTSARAPRQPPTH